jgi:SMC interacting uncharacterized protein involved in chromosome segregation
MALDPRFVALMEDSISRWNDMSDDLRKVRYLDIKRAVVECEIQNQNITGSDLEQWTQSDQIEYLKEMVLMYTDHNQHLEGQLTQANHEFEKYKRQGDSEKMALETELENVSKERLAIRAQIHAAEILKQFLERCGEETRLLEPFLPSSISGTTCKKKQE